MKTALLLLLALPGIQGCAARHARLDAIETLAITSSPPETAFALVENDTREGDRALHERALPFDPQDPLLTHLESRMRATLEQAQGVGIAAPQVGILRRVILVERQDQEGEPIQLCLNPRVVTWGQEPVEGWEGCLSVPAGFAPVLRPEEIVVEFQDRDGALHREEIRGWTARIFQHEIDHLDGILFVDRLPAGATLTPKETFRELRRLEKERENSDKALVPSVPPTQDAR